MVFLLAPPALSRNPDLARGVERFARNHYYYITGKERVPVDRHPAKMV
jgi:hypothetical protein